jgi:hypothetical protein
VWIVESHEVPLVQVNLVVQAGSGDDPAGKFGPRQSDGGDARRRGRARGQRSRSLTAVEFLGDGSGDHELVRFVRGA